MNSLTSSTNNNKTTTSSSSSINSSVSTSNTTTSTTTTPIITIPINSLLPSIHHPIPNISSTPSVFNWTASESSTLFSIPSIPMPPKSAFLAGAMAGACSRTVVSPLERLKILLQVQGPEGQYKGVFSSLTKMWKEEGFRGYMRGNGVNVLRIAPYSAVQFSSYELVKSILASNGAEIDTPRRLIAGSFAGIVSVVSTYPLDLIRSRLSIESASIGKGEMIVAGKGSSIIGMGMKVFREENGFRGLYRGLTPTAAGVAPYVAINFASYELFKGYLTSEDGSQQPGTLMKLGCGATAGAISQTLTYPLDVLRRRMQVTGMKSMGYNYNGSFDAISSIIRQEGLRGLYKGIWPNLIKVTPSMGVSFAVYEMTKEWIEASPSKTKSD